MWKHLCFGLIALANYGIYTYYEALEKMRSHYWALRSLRHKAALGRPLKRG